MPLQSGQPLQVDSTLRTFTQSFVAFIDQNRKPSPQTFPIQARGWFYMGANIAIYVNAVGVANAVGYTNVGVATLAIATAAVVYFYLEDGAPQGTQFEKDLLVRQVSDALAQPIE